MTVHGLPAMNGHFADNFNSPGATEENVSSPNGTFSRYRVPRITDVPEIEVVLVGDPEAPSTGAGEPAIVPIAAAIGNAVYDATGSRIRELPIAPRLP